MRGLSLVVASRGHSSSRCTGLSLSWPLLLQSTGSRRTGSVIVAHGPSCSVACGIFPDQGSNPCSLHWQADSQPLCHQGSPPSSVFFIWLLYSSSLFGCCLYFLLLKTSNFLLCASSLLLSSLIIFLITTLNSFPSRLSICTSVSFSSGLFFFLFLHVEHSTLHFFLSKLLFVFLCMWCVSCFLTLENLPV